MKIALTVNGRAVSGDPAPRTQLAEFLREDLLLTGTHLGCEHGVCGACTVVINGETARACITYAVACDGADLRTVEGFADDPLMAALRQAFKAEHALQCGYCTPGMLIAARDLIRRKGGLDEAAIRGEMSGNLCRCTGYVGIIRAVQSVMGERAGLLASVEPKAAHLGPLPATVSAIPVLAGRANRAEVERTLVGRVEERDPTASNSEVSGLAKGSTRPTVPPPSLLDGWDEKSATRIEETVRIAAPRAKVSALMADVVLMTACLPGARLDGPPIGDRVTGELAVRLGPIAVAFKGHGRVTRAADGLSGMLEGQARDGASGARGRKTYRLHEDGPDATRIDFDITYSLTGPLAQFSRGDLVRDLVRQVARTFAANIEAHIRGGTAAAKPSELKAGSLLWTVLRARIRRMLGLDR